MLGIFSQAGGECKCSKMMVGDGIEKIKTRQTTLGGGAVMFFFFHVRGYHKRECWGSKCGMGGVFGFNTLHVLLTFVHNERIPPVLSCIFVAYNAYL